MSEDRADLSGVWYGYYEAIGYREANGFIALIEDRDGAVTGTISEPDTTGQADTRRAYVDGRRTGSRVDFVKQYDGAVLAHAVLYSGIVDGEATEIVGRWVLAGYDGTFAMRREKFSAEELMDEGEIELIVR